MQPKFKAVGWNVSLAFILLGPIAGAVTREPDASRVVEVTVFRDRASVKRRLSVRLPKGATTVVFRGVTPLADLDSMKAYLSDRTHVTLMGLRTEAEYSTHSGNPELEKWNLTRQRAEQRRRDLLSQSMLLQQGNVNLRALAHHYHESFSLNLHQNTWSKGGFESFLKLLATESDQFNGSWWKLFQEYQKVSEELAFAQAKVQELSSASDLKRMAVSVDLLADVDTRLDVDIQYLVGQCGWSPAYDIRLDSKAKTATFEQGAFIWQSTGEPWSGVSLALSNVRSELRPVPPSLSPYVLSVREVKKVQTSIAGATDSATSLTVSGKEDSDDENSEGSGIARVFKVPGLQNVRSGMAKTRVLVAARSSPYVEHLELVPSRFLRVYRKVETHNAFSWDLETGPASIYWDGDFLQQIVLDGVAKGDEVGINAGVDTDFVVQRWKQDKTAEPGVLDSHRHHLREVSIRLRHFGEDTRAVRIYEPVPVSEIKDVVVKVPESTAGLVEDKLRPSWKYWDLKLEPKEWTQLSLKLDVGVPSTFKFTW